MEINKIPKIILAFLAEVRIEMMKINWPSREETLRYTLVVLGISAAIAVFLGGLDFLFNYLLNRFII